MSMMSMKVIYMYVRENKTGLIARYHGVVLYIHAASLKSVS